MHPGRCATTPHKNQTCRGQRSMEQAIDISDAHHAVYWTGAIVFILPSLWLHCSDHRVTLPSLSCNMPTCMCFWFSNKISRGLMVQVWDVTRTLQYSWATARDRASMLVPMTGHHLFGSCHSGCCICHIIPCCHMRGGAMWLHSCMRRPSALLNECVA